MFIPLTLYVCLLGLLYLVWRSEGVLDRKDALYFYLLFVAASWVTILTDLILTQNYTSTYGRQVLAVSSVVAIIGGAVGMLAYLLWPVERNEPNLSVSLTELKPEEKIQEVRVRLADGREKCREARFGYITVTNSGERTARQVQAMFHSYRMVFVPIRRRAYYTADTDQSESSFEEQLKQGKKAAFDYAILNDQKRIKDEMDIRISPEGESFALFFMLKDEGWLTVPCETLVSLPIPSVIQLCVYLFSDNDRYEAVFEVNVRSWDSFEVRQVGPTVRRSNV